jgi:hypothetical protein
LGGETAGGVGSGSEGLGSETAGGVGVGSEGLGSETAGGGEGLGSETAGADGVFTGPETDGTGTPSDGAVPTSAP